MPCRHRSLGGVQTVDRLTLTGRCALFRSYIASWSELMPTDGTHVEVVQGVTSTADTVTSTEIARK